MSDLTPSIIPLDKGLSLQVSPLTAPVGSVTESLNYEQVDFQGQKRIDGFTRYDGQLVADINEYVVLTTSPAITPVVGSSLVTDAGLYGVVLYVDGTTIHVAEINSLNAPVIGVVDTVMATTVTARSTGTDTASTPDEHYNNLLAYNGLLRTNVTELPGPVAGLHWFRDRLYAVANLPIISIDGTTPEIFPTDTISVNGVEAKVVASFTLANTRQIFVDSVGSSEFSTAGNTVLVNTVASGTTLDTFESGAPYADIASFFDSRTEQQVIDEDTGPTYTYGWRHLPTGWLIHFINGKSLYGSLTAVNQHPATSSTGSSTSITGDGGKALILTQKVDITNGQAQVNGWKTSTFPDIYSLEVAALEGIEDYSIYADAFIQWDGTTGVVLAPGSDQINMTEYPATGYVEVEV